MQIIHQAKTKFYFILIAVCSISFFLHSCYPELEEPENDTALLEFIFPNAYLYDTRAYLNNSVYASKIENSILIGGDNCSFGELPLIGMETDSPTIDDIMQRLVVSHDWMGQRFREILETYPSEFLMLFKSVRAIVIDDDIRPAFYRSYSSSIYLDANAFWLSKTEKESINPRLDFRSNYSDDLIFHSFSRYVDSNNKKAYKYVNPRASYWPRTLEDIRLLVARVLLHELAHANDFFPPQLYNSFSRVDDPRTVATALKGEWISERLNKATPLNSTMLKGIAKVLFHGEKASDTQKKLTATDIGLAFEQDCASDDYNYSTPHEDVAMLFEEAMMKYFFDVDRIMAFTDLKNKDSHYIVRWGTRNRFADARVRKRAEFVIHEILPNVNFDDFMQNLPTPKPLTTGIDWRESIDKLSPGSKASKIKNTNEPDFIEFYKPYL